MSHAYDEIHSQAEIWRTAIPSAIEQWERIRQTLEVEPGTHFLFVGSGTSLYLAQCAAHSFQEITGHVSHAVPSSEVFLSTASTVPVPYPVVAFVISRSGSTTEAIIAADYLQQNCPNVKVLGLSCNLGTELEKRASYTITLPQAAEQAVVMTRTFTTMLLALQVIAAQNAGDSRFLDELTQLPDLLIQAMPGFERFAEEVGSPLSQDQYIYLGLGPYKGLAEEGTLKLKEMTQTVCEAYNPLEFRHGPISIVDSGTTVLLLEGLRERAYLPNLEADLKQRGALVVALGPYPSPHADVTVNLPEGLSDIARCLLYLPPLQLIAYYRARALGLDPDQPRNLTQVVVLDGEGRAEVGG